MGKVELNFISTLEERLKAPQPLIQVILGPRQVGKTTGVLQYLEKSGNHSHYVAADDLLTGGREWIYEQWQEAQQLEGDPLLVIDEIQKISGWSESIKKLWDAQRNSSQKIKLILLGSSSLTLQKGLQESLAGRFELIPVYHWDYLESKQLLKMSLEDYLRYGGYPGTYQFIKEPERWSQYIKGSIIDMVISKDILNFAQVKKPALFRQAFEVLCGYPSQEISYRKLLGQLQDHGNTDLIKHYISLYEGAFLFKALQKFSKKNAKSKSSSPKILPLCPSFYSLYGKVGEEDKKARVFEATVGIALAKLNGQLYYWREGDYEVDFVLVWNAKIYGVEVKSGRKQRVGGLLEFERHFPKAQLAIINTSNYEKFIENPRSFLKP